ncbi:ankyrin repeat domain-containing protein [Paludibacter sp.]|uniref:ankyrin repeat domain-containing protein n=1 Tax=Paludibacter sp. TaxID=1898105 RepID=UPI00135309BE|nr:ankyrin repeat domain-containing protein [Paludibacter sp.]MTK53625.1 ankyrin repeat domain-containing protein [Paludibacter sp.]
MKKLLTSLLLLTTLQGMSQELFEAYKQKDLRKIESLLINKENPNQRNGSGVSLMFIAAGDNNVEVGKLLLKYGGNVDLPVINSDATPILLACQENAYEFVKFIVENGGDLNRRFKAAGNQTPIRFACKTGSIQLVSYLLDHGANLEDTPDDQITPLIQAARSNHYDLVKFLIEKGANVNAYAATHDKECALNQAILNKNAEIVELLLENGALVTFADDKGNSSLKLAKKSKNKRIIELIEAKTK